MQKLEGAIKQYNAKIVIISDITCLFSALQEYEGQRVLSQIATYLSNFARENNIIVIATYLPHRTTQRTNRLQTLLNAKASVVLSINQTAYSKTLSLNKHPYLPSGSVELPSGIIKITDFIGDSE
jgi:replicative DNA helicase